MRRVTPPLSTRVCWALVLLLPAVGQARDGGDSGLGADNSARWRWNVPLSDVVRGAGGRKLLLLLVSRDDRPPLPRAGRLSSAAARDLLRSAALARATAGLVTLGYEAHAGEGRHVVRRYNVVVFPTLLLIGDDAVELGRLSGPREQAAAALAARIGDLVSGDHSAQRLEQLLRRAPNDVESRFRLLRRLALRGEAEAAEQQLDRVVALDREDARGLASRGTLLVCDVVLLRSLADARAALACLRDLIRRYPRSSVIDYAKLARQRAERALAAARQ